MTTFFERYQAGQHVQVWTDLVALGAQTRQEPVFSDAKAVANETMRRARHNIELIVQRLKRLRYDFVTPNVMTNAPNREIIGYLDEFEREVGPIPLSIRAWCELVGSVQLLGTYPKLSYYDSSPIQPLLGKALGQGKLDPSDMRLMLGMMQIPTGGQPIDDAHLDSLQAKLNSMLGGFQEELSNSPLMAGRDLNQLNKSGQKGARKTPRFKLKDEDKVLGDPLYFDMEEINAELYHEWLDDQAQPGANRADVFSVIIAPDILHKSGVSGSGGYEIVLPNASADAELLYESHQTTFVNYLRIAFRWGGFPGLEHSTNRIDEVLAQLTQDLLPI